MTDTLMLNTQDSSMGAAAVLWIRWALPPTRLMVSMRAHILDTVTGRSEQRYSNEALTGVGQPAASGA